MDKSQAWRRPSFPGSSGLAMVVRSQNLTLMVGSGNDRWESLQSLHGFVPEMSLSLARYR
jgi:hypothetical protein